MSKGPSPHLTWAEMACKDEARTAYPPPWRETRGVMLAQMFERFRALVGRPLAVGSVYRTPKHNRAIGGAQASQHVEGLAIDLHCPKDVRLEVFHATAAHFWRDNHCHGLGCYPWGVHLDLRAGARAKWYSGHPKESGA